MSKMKGELTKMKGMKYKVGIALVCAVMVLGGSIIIGNAIHDEVVISADENKITRRIEKKETITSDEANTIALNKTGGGEVVESKLERDDGLLKYEIKIVNGDMKHEVDIDASTKEIIKYEIEKIVKPQPMPNNNSVQTSTQETQLNTTLTTPKPVENVTQTTNQKPQPIGIEQAQKIALTLSEGRIVKCEYDYDDQKYEVEILNGNIEHEIDIHAYSGAILKHESEIEDFD